MTIIWYMVPEISTATDRFFWSSLAIFWNENIKKMKKTPEDIITLHKCTKNHDHRLYCSWDMAHDGCNCYFSFWAILFHFTLLTAQKMNISKTWKKHMEISSFYTCVQKIMITCYTACVTDCYLSFWSFFCPFIPLTAQKMKIWKKWKRKKKKRLTITSFYTHIPKIMIICYTVPEIWCMTNVIVIFHFGLFFALLPPPLVTAQKIKISKKWKKCLEIS